jgi:phospholipase/carboxylesterase
MDRANYHPPGSQDPHASQPIFTIGDQPKHATAAMVLVHGRGASAADILSLAAEIYQPGVAYLAPEATGSTWYPYRFNQPRHVNEPWLSSALALLEKTTNQLEQAGLPPEKILLVGFSQGACLALEFAARSGKRFGGAAGLSGGLIGSDEELQGYSASLESMPVFLGCSAVDPHIPKERVELTAEILRELGASVTMRLYPGMGHMVNQDELEAVKKLLEGL